MCVRHIDSRHLYGLTAARFVEDSHTMFGPVSEGMRLFRNGATVAVLGYSEKPHRVSNKVTQFLIQEGNNVTGINPNIDPEDRRQIPVKQSLAELSGQVDIIQIFRNSAALPSIAEEILGLDWKPKMVWCQQGVVDIMFQQRLEESDIPVVMDACPYALRSFL